MRLYLHFNELDQRLLVKWGETDLRLKVKLGELFKLHYDVPVWDGKYAVTPTPDGEVMQTANKLMADNVTINPIPFFNVSNASGGSTVYIANEV